MNKSIRNILLVSAGLTLALPFFFGAFDLRDYLPGISVSAFFIGLIDVFVGVISLVIFAAQGRKTTLAQGFLLGGSILLLASFTLCSTGYGLKI